MRKIFPLLFLFLFMSNAFACSCTSMDFMRRFQNAKFIAKVKVLSIKDDKSDPHYSTATIQVLELFKGAKVTSIKVSRGGCSLYMPVNTVWLIFASENRGKYPAVDGCSGCLEFEKKANNQSESGIFYDRVFKRQVAMLKYLKKHNIQNNNPDRLEIGYASDCYKSFKGYSLKQSYAIYEIEVLENLTVKNIKPLITFENKGLSQKIMKCMRNNLRVFKRDVKTIKKPIKLLVGFYFFQAGNGKKSAISVSDQTIY